jgi:hypothetical protein
VGCFALIVTFKILITMAIVQFSSLVDGLRNSIGNQTFSVNRYGAFVRSRVTPANPSTSRQLAVRAFIPYLNTIWAGLSETDRLTWVDGTTLHPRLNAFGEPYTLSPYNFFISCNLPFQNRSEDFMEAFVDSETPAQITDVSLEISAVDEQIFIECTVPTYSSYTNVAVFASPLLSPGINYCKAAYRYLFTIQATSLFRYNMYAEWNTQYGALTVGQKIFVKLYAWYDLNGLQSLISQGSGIVGI